MTHLLITERAYGFDALVANFAIVSLHAPFCYFVGITAMEIAKSDGDSIAQVALNVGKSMMNKKIEQLFDFWNDTMRRQLDRLERYDEKNDR